MAKEYTVLAVDDEPDVLLFVKAALRAEGYRVLTAANGREALAQARSEKPDLVLLDVMMPGMDGFEVLERLRQNEATLGIPVIMLTILTERERKLLAIKRGVQYYITKPFEVQDLITKVRLAIGEGRANG